RRPAANVAQLMHIIGDVTAGSCIIVDDMVAPAGTLSNAAAAPKAPGAATVVAYCTHAVLSGKAIENVNAAELDELIVTDTIPLSAAAQACDRIRVLRIANMLAEAMRRVSNEESLSAMFR